MTLSIMLHHLLKTPSDLYESHGTDEQLVKLMRKHSIETASDSDQWFDLEWDALFSFLADIGVSSGIFEPLYIERDLVRNASVLDWEIDTEMLKCLSAYQIIPAGIAFSKIKIDFYNLKRVIMFKREMNIVATGFISADFFEMYSDDVDRLIRNSIYYDKIETLDMENVDILEVEILKAALAPYRMDGNTDNGLFSKLYFRLLELQEIRARMKAHLFSIDINQAVTVYE